MDSARLEQRRAAVPAITYPPELPISQHKDEIAEAIRDHQVVIVAGETGSGKTTQLPKICLELGRGIEGTIGHTQPRRLAARTVADRVAEELSTSVGEVVGFKVRFTDRSSDSTLVKLMTDGILLAEIQRDRDLRQYDTLIIDEAHERSLNIDFILGYLKQLLPRRPELKVIITSATIDPERFSRHFENAPILEVSGRTYPVEVRYRPVVEEADDADRDQLQAICDAVDELVLEPPGDILVFLSGEREIRDTADALQRQNLRQTEVLPLYARLSHAEQLRVFQSHPGRRIVLATNVAETSLTVPGIKYVIDPGTARISRYSARLKVQRLPIEPVSQASANQRMGRCGRTSDGICIRLYAEEDFLGRPEFTEPEILRTNLASVILQMNAAGLGDIGAFPFVEPPDRRNIRDGMDLLNELGALVDGRLTKLGRRLAQLPLDPRLARMVLAAGENDCVREVMVIASALSIQDPRERPVEKQEAASQAHARFADKESDFSTYLNLWRYLQEKQRELSSNQFRKLCRAEFLNYLRVREWQDIESQLRQLTKQLDVTVNSEPADPQKVVLSLLAGLLSHIGVKDEEEKGDPATRGRRRTSFEYVGARGARFAIFPGSSLFKKSPKWVMAAELVETSRLWARIVAKIEPEWVEPIAPHLIRRSYSEPHWSKSRGAVMAYEKVTLYGVPIVSSRLVQYGRIDPVLSRELFIRHALVEGDWVTHHSFFAENRELLEEVSELENRVRRRDILVDEETLFAFYDSRVGPDVVSAAHFDSWWKKARRESPDLLSFSKAMLVNEGAGVVSEEEYPREWHSDGIELPLTYQFEPGALADGVTVDVPLSVLNQVSEDGFEWHVPGMRLELVTELIRSLPKSLRRNFVPAPNYAREVLPRLDGSASLLESLERELLRMSGVRVTREDWDLAKVPDHLKVTFRVLDEKGRELATGKDLDVLKKKLRGSLREVISSAASGLEVSGQRTWTFGTLQREFSTRRGGLEVRAYPALVDEGSSVGVRLLDTPEAQAASMWAGTRRLLLLNVGSPVRYVLGQLSNRTKLALSTHWRGSSGDLFDDSVACAVDKLVADAGGPAWDEAGFRALFDAVRSSLHDLSLDTVQKVGAILSLAHEVTVALDALPASLSVSVADVKAQLTGLVYPGFVTATGWARLPDVERYLRAVAYRLTKLPENPYRDRQWTDDIQAIEAEHRTWLASLPESRRTTEAVRAVRWMLEELRVSFFAQHLRARQPISDKRLRRAMEAASSS